MLINILKESQYFKNVVMDYENNGCAYAEHVIVLFNLLLILICDYCFCDIILEITQPLF